MVRGQEEMTPTWLPWTWRERRKNQVQYSSLGSEVRKWWHLRGCLELEGRGAKTKGDIAQPEEVGLMLINSHRLHLKGEVWKKQWVKFAVVLQGVGPLFGVGPQSGFKELHQAFTFTLSSIKSKLKTHLFSSAYCCVVFFSVYHSITSNTNVYMYA